MPDAQDHQFGILAGQLARIEQVPGDRQPRKEQQAMLAEHVEQVELGRPDAAGADLGDRPVERPELAEAARRDPGRRTHDCRTR
jgi:hypothetical protein